LPKAKSPQDTSFSFLPPSPSRRAWLEMRSDRFQRPFRDCYPLFFLWRGTAYSCSKSRLFLALLLTSTLCKYDSFGQYPAYASGFSHFKMLFAHKLA
jgi:hypothetical protein